MASGERGENQTPSVRNPAHACVLAGPERARGEKQTPRVRNSSHGRRGVRTTPARSVTDSPAPRQDEERAMFSTSGSRNVARKIRPSPVATSVRERTT